MPQYCIKPDCSIAARFPQSAHETDFVGLTRRSPHRITLRVCGCGSLPAHIRTSVPLSRHFVLIHVCVDHADSFLCMLRMPENCLRVDGLIQQDSGTAISVPESCLRRNFHRGYRSPVRKSFRYAYYLRITLTFTFVPSDSSTLKESFPPMPVMI